MKRLFWLPLVFAASCSSSTPTKPPIDACPRAGTIPADLRDVERDAEGVSYSVFGAYPDRMPDFTRASGVLSLLEQVWNRGKTTCSGLPTDVQTNIDTAIATLKMTIPAKDQKASAYAANDIHVQMAPLFAYFNPDTPVAVVRMDALFLRIGIDAWFGDWAAYHTELTALQADWATLKAQAEAKVPTCHRVAGTATVVSDLDQTLANLVAYEATKNVDGAEVESDAGLLEVDILELLYDCVADGAQPSAGLGSSCKTDGDCDAGQVCDTANAGGKCAPDAATTHVGEPCTTTVDCGTYPRNACNSQIGDGFPGGYCAMEPCDDVMVCSPGATCVSFPFETPACLKSCATDADCRTNEGYVCQLFSTMPPVGFGPLDHACAFPCKDDAGCNAPLTCDVASGKCIP